MKLAGIYTIRDTLQPYYWDVVFEWEDEFSKILSVPLIPIGNDYDKIYKPSWVKKILNRLNYYRLRDRFFFSPKNYFIAFHIGPPGEYSFHSRKNVIPIIIDFWKDENIKRFESIFSLSQCVFITSKEAYSFLLDKQIKIPIHHLALSLPDRFNSTYSMKREFDIIQLGRQNQKLESFMDSFMKEFPSTDYVHAEKNNGRLEMWSTQRGSLGEFKNRESFLNLLRQAKVSLLSAPGMDDDSKRTGGFSPVTPRFLESAACGCHLVGIFPDNDDFDYYKVESICSRVGNYEEFKQIVLRCLLNDKQPDYSKFLEKHVSSVRANQLLEKLSLYAN